MQVIQRYLYKELITTIATVSAGFLGLFMFFDFVDELSNIGKMNPFVPDPYGLLHAVLFVLSLTPSRLYELLPITVLIGATIVMARFAQSSEFTVLRTSGLSPLRALQLLASLGMASVLVTFVLGDYLVPAANRAGQLLKATYLGKLPSSQNGAWLKDSDGSKTYAISVGSIAAETRLSSIRIFEFDLDGGVKSLTFAIDGGIQPSGVWRLNKVVRHEFFRTIANSTAAPRVVTSTLDSFDWPSSITIDMVATALLKPERMSTWDLYKYKTHLQNNAQSSQQYEIEFWRKIFYPVSCLVMLVLALPFAYFHFRGGSMTGYIFAGVLIGISFFVVNTAVGYFGNLNNWQPWLAAVVPSMIYSLIALLGFSWLVVYR